MVAAVGWTAVARAQPGPAAPAPPADAGARKAAAQVHLDRGNEAFTQDQFAEALVEFQAALELYPSTRLEFNIGQCERALGHAAAAVDHFQRFLDGPEEISPGLRQEAERYVAELESAEAVPPAPPEPALVVAPPAPAAAPSVPAPHLLETKPPPPESKPLLKRWWFWAAVGAVAVGTVVVVAAWPRDPKCTGQCF